MATTYGTVITNAGAALIAECILNGTKLPITEAAVGDGDGEAYSPTPAQAELKREKWRGAIASATISSTTANMIDVKIVIGEDVAALPSGRLLSSRTTALDRCLQYPGH